jgi:HEAT repeat protein
MPAVPPVGLPVGPLVSALADKDGTVAQAAVRALGRLGNAGVTQLVAALSSSDETVAYYASEALATIGKPSEDAVLAAAVPGKPTARWAAITLGQIGDSRSIPALETLSQSPDADTAYAASSALARVKPG